MPLLSFSESSHVSLLLSGAKCQTTRAPRKTPLKVGDILHCWYKPRQKKTCGNCIVQGCENKNKILIDDGKHQLRYSTCSEHRNFFGKAKVPGILHFSPKLSSPTGQEYSHFVQMRGFDFHLACLGNQTETFKEAWARADGFANFAEAHKWFTKSTKNDEWMMLPLDVIIFEPLKGGL